MEELQHRMNYPEFLSWIQFRNRWGTLHPGLRIDRAIARSSAFFGNMMARKNLLSPEDFSIHDKSPEPEASPKNVYQLLSNVAKQNRKAG